MLDKLARAVVTAVEHLEGVSDRLKPSSVFVEYSTTYKYAIPYQVLMR